MHDADALDAATLRILRILRRRDVPRAELAGRLAAAGVAPDLAEAALARVAGWGFLDDARFAAAFAERRTRQAYGRERIRAELVDRGVPEALADAALASDDEPAAEAAETARAVRALARRYHAEDDPARGARWLAQRGFGEEVVRAAVAAHFARGLDD